MRSAITILCGLLITASLVPSAHAVAVLNLGGALCHNQAKCILGVAGAPGEDFTATFSRPEITVGTPDFFAFSEGLIFGTRTFPHAFDLSFDRSVAWQGGRLGVTHAFDGFSITGQDVSVSGLLADTGVGAFDLASPIHFLADQTYRFDGRMTAAFSIAILSEMQFAPVVPSASPSVVPVPATLPMMLMFLGGLGWLGYRKGALSRSSLGNRCADHAVA